MTRLNLTWNTSQWQSVRLSRTCVACYQGSVRLRCNVAIAFNVASWHCAVLGPATQSPRYVIPRDGNNWQHTQYCGSYSRYDCILHDDPSYVRFMELIRGILTKAKIKQLKDNLRIIAEQTNVWKFNNFLSLMSRR